MNDYNRLVALVLQVRRGILTVDECRERCSAEEWMEIEERVMQYAE